jgi:hypothetical protein
MKRLVLAACVSLAVLLLPVAASAQPAHADSPKVTITLAQNVVLGTTTLRPGEYKFQCRMIDGKTFLVVTSSDGKEITRVACEQEILDAKVPESELRTLLRPNGTRTLTAVRLKGEKVSHRIVD